MYNNSYSYPSRINETLFLFAKPHIQYSHQLNLNSQIDFSVSFYGGPAINKKNDIKQRYSISAVIGYSYELTDRLVVAISNSFGYNIINLL